MIQVQKARRAQSKLLIGIQGATGSGKTHSALVIAQGMVNAIREKQGADYKGKGICVIDSESYRSTYYADLLLDGAEEPISFDIINLEEPYSPERYIESIRYAEDGGYDVIIIDSISHEWNGTGGILETVTLLGQAKDSGGTFATWGKVTPRHNAFVEALTSPRAHIIVTMRTKALWVVEKDGSGRHKPRKIGTEPQQREGLEYELAVLLELNSDHLATVANDRTRRLGEAFTPSASTGRVLVEWHLDGVDPEQIASLQKEIREASNEAGGWKSLVEIVEAAGERLPVGEPRMWSLKQLEQVAELIKKIQGG